MVAGSILCSSGYRLWISACHQLVSPLYDSNELNRLQEALTTIDRYYRLLNIVGDKQVIHHLLLVIMP